MPKIQGLFAIILFNVLILFYFKIKTQSATFYSRQLFGTIFIFAPHPGPLLVWRGEGDGRDW
jgi:hypothetical protein